MSEPASQAHVADHLERIVEALRRLTEEGDEGNFLIVHADRRGNYYVQLAGARGAPTVRAEAVSNAFLEARDALGPGQHARLLALGWQAPTPGESENYYRDFDARNDADRRRIAEALLRALTDVYAVPADRKLEIELTLE